MSRLWEKGLPLDERILRYTAGEDHQLDARLIPYDVRGSIAHAEMLTEQGLISATDCTAICDGLTALSKSFEAGDWCINLEDEDAHTALESRLTDAIGPTGGRLHLGRSRNDQVLTALRMYLRDASNDLVSRVNQLRKSIGNLQDRQGDVKLPGYTHMQHAMPSSVALWCGGFNEGFADAAEGLESLKKRINKNPLGSAAGYGAPGLPLDRDATTTKLGFDITQNPVTAAPGTGDPVLDGEVGEVLVTSFNPDYPLIRFATGDLSAVMSGTSPCGRSNTRIKGWMGRADQTTKIKGMFVRPEQVAALVARHDEVTRARVVASRQGEMDVMTVRIETEAEDMSAYESSVLSTLKLRGAIELVGPGDLPRDGVVIEDQRRYD
jgi:hypothetical protein